jgi:hypothetical protein
VQLCWLCLTVSASHPAWVCKPAAQVAVDRFDFSALASVRPTTVPAVRFDVLECLAVHSRGSAVGFAAFVGTGQNIFPDTPCRTAHGNGSWAIPSPLRATPSAIATPSVLCRFLRSSLTEAPFLHRHYPASSVVGACPPPHTAPPVSRELPVDPYRDHRWGFPCYLSSPMRTYRRHYPGRFNGAYSLVCLHSQRPSPCNSKVGSCDCFVEA